MLITKDYLKSILNYNPVTGEFTWRVRCSTRLSVGDKAGTKSKKTYTIIQINKTPYKAHRLAFLYMTGKMPTNIDHINGVRSDNRWENLREVTPSQNSRNKKIGKNNKTGIMGVTKNNRNGKWRAEVRLNGKIKYLMESFDFFEACCARKSAERKYGFHLNHGRST